MRVIVSFASILINTSNRAEGVKNSNPERLHSGAAEDQAGARGDCLLMALVSASLFVRTLSNL